MIARKILPATHVAWNRAWGAPLGYPFYLWATRLPKGAGRLLKRTLFTVLPFLRGPFAFQENSRTREAEYPWAFYATPITSGMRVLEIGGGLSGFQFVLDRSGCEVVNVDPGSAAHGRGWPVDARSIGMLNRMFGTKIMLHNCFLPDAQLKPATFDRIFSISVLEHIPLSELSGIMRIAYDLLKQGGYFVLTMDLFVNLKPFCSRETNEYGRNMSVKKLLEEAPFQLVSGNRNELWGYPEFDLDRVMCSLDNLMLGEYPALTQMVVLQKPAAV